MAASSPRTGPRPGGARNFLYEHLAQVLGPVGVAVLRDDRRPAVEGHDVPLPTQAADALVAVRRLLDGGPVGLW